LQGPDDVQSNPSFTVTLHLPKKKLWPASNIPEEYLKHLSTTWESARTIRLWIEQNGECYWCGIKTLLRLDPGYHLTRKNGATLSAKAATLDHLYSKFHPCRNRKTSGQRLVMACNACNLRRGKQECIAINNNEPMIHEIF